jgi:branched-chain amino acid transport system substrate-binding protein
MTHESGASDLPQQSPPRRDRTSRRWIAAVSGVALIGALAACGSSSSSGGSSAGGGAGGDTVRIGLAIGKTGYLAAVDTPFGNGVNLGADYLNKNGGMGGKKIEVVTLDMQSNAAKAVPVTNQLINQRKVGVLIGGSTSAATAADAPIIGPRKVPMIAASVLPSGSNWVFSTLQPVAKTNQIDLDFAKSLHATKVAVLYSQTPYGQSAAAAMGSAAKAGGLTVVASEAVETNATDLTPQLSKAKAAGAQAIIDVLSGPVHIVEAKGAATLNLTIPLIMGTDEVATFAPASEAYAASYITAIAPQVYPKNNDPQIKAANAKFLPIYQAAYGDKPGIASAARGWDSMMILAEAVKASGAITGDQLRDALEQVTYTGTMSAYKFAAGDLTGQAGTANPLGIVRENGGKLEVVYTPTAS